MNLINEIENNQLKTDLPELNSGDSVKVNVKVSEGNRERIQTSEDIAEMRDDTARARLDQQRLLKNLDLMNRN